MKQALIFFLCCFSISGFGQEVAQQEIQTTAGAVTVFIDGAQVTRTKSVDLKAGQSILKFVKLSPYIDAKSIQVKLDGEATVLSVNQQQNFLTANERTDELKSLQVQSEKLNGQLQLENAYLSVAREEMSFLQANKSVGGRDQQLSVTNLQQASEYFSKRLTELKLKEIEHLKTIDNLAEQKANIENQMKTAAGKDASATGEIWVKVESKQAIAATFELSYLVKNAGWFPGYDIRAKSIVEPIELIYKANVHQDTREEWKNVKLSFSSSDPNVSGVAPQLQTYFLNYNTLPPVYKQVQNEVRGRVVDPDGAPLPGVMVLVSGTTIGAMTDLNGNYTIAIPGVNSQLTYSFIGMVSQTLPVTSSVMNVTLQSDVVAMDEVVVVGYGVQNSDYSDALSGRAAGVSVSTPKNKELKIRGTSSIPVATMPIEKQTAVNFDIQMPWTIPSDNKNYTVDLAVYELPAQYQYYCVPKADRDAFLIAHIVDWEKYNLLEGEANIFFEDTYIGKTILDVRTASDTLNLSLGRDKKVIVSREKRSDVTSKQFIGSKKEETREWVLTVRNTKGQPIDMVLFDQVPVSMNQDIEVTVSDKSGAKQTDDTGEIRWTVQLAPAEQRKFNLKYSVKYPKYQQVYVE